MPRDHDSYVLASPEDFFFRDDEPEEEDDMPDDDRDDKPFHDIDRPEEADRCEHCGAILRIPPRCCAAAERDYHEAQRVRLDAMEEHRGIIDPWDNGEPFYPGEFDGDSD